VEAHTINMVRGIRPTHGRIYRRYKPLTVISSRAMLFHPDFGWRRTLMRGWKYDINA
jgi:hypothetical protein